MATDAIKVVTSERVEVAQTRTISNSSPIRIKTKTKSVLDDLLKKVNKNHVGKKVKADDVICYALNLVNNDHLAEISNAALTNKDRLEFLFSQAKKQHRNLTRDEFYGLLMDGRLHKKV